MIRFLPPQRLALAAAVAVLAFWALSQLTVATWLAHEANQRESDWAQGVSPWRWDFSRAASVIRSGSHGLDSAQHQGNHLSIALGDDGVAGLSLALHGNPIDLTSVDRARIRLSASAPFELTLLPALPGQHIEWARITAAAGTHERGMTLAPLPASTAPALQLRIQSTPGSRVELHHLALLARPCDSTSPCSGHRRTAPAFNTPESLLAYRDASTLRAPAVAIEAGGIFGVTAQWLAPRLRGASDTLLRTVTLGLLPLVLFALACRVKRRTSVSRTRALLELLMPLGGALVLLLAGWPARDTPLQAGMTLMMCLSALALLPPPPHDWHWRGNAAAWRSVLTFTALAMLFTAPLTWLPHEPRPRHDALDLLRYPLWALVQQWLLIAAIAPRMRLLLPDTRAAALACGLLFALMHAPNFALMLFTLAGGSIWAWLGQRHRALLPLAASHAVLGLWLMHVAPSWLLRSAEVGGRFLMPP